MRNLLLIFVILFFTPTKAEEDIKCYLTNHRTDLRKEVRKLEYPIVGFTVIHGSSKAEEAEIALISSLQQKNDSLYYFPEIDYASACYFNRYLESGDTTLLKKQIINYGHRVPQEEGIAVYEKWKRLRELSKEMPVKVFGIDILIDYGNYIDLLLEITTQEYPQHKILELCHSELLSGNDISDNIKILVNEHIKNTERNNNSVKDNIMMDLLMNDLANSFQTKTGQSRDSVIYENYVRQDKIFNFRNQAQFIRMGIFHMVKENMENMNQGFIGMLIKKERYHSNEIYSVLGILSESEVLWKKTYNEAGKYIGFSTKSDGFYTGSDIFNSELLCKNALSDITFFPLGNIKTPFLDDDFLILKNKTVMVPKKGKSTLDYIDAVILISQSPANIPIEELQ